MDGNYMTKQIWHFDFGLISDIGSNQCDPDIAFKWNGSSPKINTINPDIAYSLMHYTSLQRD